MNNSPDWVVYSALSILFLVSIAGMIQNKSKYQEWIDQCSVSSPRHVCWAMWKSGEVRHDTRN